MSEKKKTSTQQSLYLIAGSRLLLNPEASEPVGFLFSFYLLNYILNQVTNLIQTC